MMGLMVQDWWFSRAPLTGERGAFKSLPVRDLHSVYLLWLVSSFLWLIDELISRFLQMAQTIRHMAIWQLDFYRFYMFSCVSKVITFFLLLYFTALWDFSDILAWKPRDRSKRKPHALTLTCAADNICSVSGITPSSKGTYFDIEWEVTGPSFWKTQHS